MLHLTAPRLAQGVRTTWGRLHPHKSYTHPNKPRKKGKKKWWHHFAALVSYQCLYCYYLLLDNLTVLIDDITWRETVHSVSSLAPTRRFLICTGRCQTAAFIPSMLVAPLLVTPASLPFLTLSCVHFKTPLQTWNGWSRVFQESLLVRVLVLLLNLVLLIIAISIYCRLSTIPSLPAPLFFLGYKK